jgi:hypothetical protein
MGNNKLSHTFLAEAVIDFTDWITALAGASGFRIQPLGENLVATRCNLSGERKQVVWIRLLGTDTYRNSVVVISSPALKIGSGHLLERKLANALLRQNAGVFHGGWAIETVEGDDYLIMHDTQIAETVDAEELAASILSVATMADTMEKQFVEADRF